MKVVIDLLFKSGADRHIIAESESTKQALEDLYSMQLEPVDGGAYSIEENEIAFVYASPYDGSLSHKDKPKDFRVYTKDRRHLFIAKVYQGKDRANIWYWWHEGYGQKGEFSSIADAKNDCQKTLEESGWFPLAKWGELPKPSEIQSDQPTVPSPMADQAEYTED